MKIQEVLFCCCSDYHRVSSESILKLLPRLAANGIKFSLIPDLCYRAIHQSGFLKQLSNDGILVAACHTRAIEALFAAADVSPPPMLDLTSAESEDFFNFLPKAAPESFITPEIPQYAHEWKAWFPAIDRQRCNGCGKCIDYCLFGVYSRINRKVTVAQPANCKTNCPACARMCPQQAIIFPKHPEAPVNGGENPSTSPPAGADKPDDDLYTKLAQRRRRSRKDKLTKD